MVASHSQHHRMLEQGAQRCTHALTLAEEQSLGIGLCRAKTVSDVFHDKDWSVWLQLVDFPFLSPAICSPLDGLDLEMRANQAEDHALQILHSHTVKSLTEWSAQQ